MSGHKRWERDLTEMAARLGMQHVRIEKGRKHMRLHGVIRGGALPAIVVASTPGDRRTLRNIEALVRRVIRSMHVEGETAR